MVAADDERKAAPFPFTDDEVAALTRGSMRSELVARMLERHRPPDVTAPAVKDTKLGPAQLDREELARATAGDMDEELAERFVEAGKRDRSRKRTVAKGTGRPRLRPPSQRRKR